MNTELGLLVKTSLKIKKPMMSNDNCMSFKKDFPVFQNYPDLVFMDSASSTQKPKSVIDRISRHLESGYANIHRGLYELSDMSEDLYDKSKSIVAKNLSVKPWEVIYTYNTTYWINLLAYSLFFSGYLKKWDKILISIAEHHSNIVPWMILKEHFGIRIEYIYIDENDNFDINDFYKKYDENTKLVSLTYVSNVTGTIFNIQDISSRLNPETILLVDGSQAVPNFPVDISSLGCDIFVFTWHKVMANTGIWVLIWKKELLKKLKHPFGWGGSIKDVDECTFLPAKWKEWFEMWTPNISWAVSLLAAFEYVESIWWFGTIWKKEQQLTEYMLNKFLERKDQIKLLWKETKENRLWVFSFVFEKDFSPIRFGEFMAMKNICIRCGWHCAHPYLKSMWYKWACRASVYVYNDFDDIDKFFEAIDEYLANL